MVKPTRNQNIQTQEEKEPEELIDMKMNQRPTVMSLGKQSKDEEDKTEE